jgi:hypothetical protein
MCRPPWESGRAGLGAAIFPGSAAMEVRTEQNLHELSRTCFLALLMIED